jgi:hypothetical protein
MTYGSLIKRAVPLLLAALIIFAAACGAESETPSASDTAAADVTTETTAAETLSFDPGLPEADYGGETFTFWLRKCHADFWTVADIWTEDLSGDALNDAIYERNAFIEDKYNVKIAQFLAGDAGRSSSEIALNVKKAVFAGEKIDSVISSGYATGFMTINGLLYELSAIPYLDFSKPWWDHNLNESTSLYDRSYFAGGELTTADNNAVNILVFVKDLVTDYNLESPYDLVKSGAWTIDKLIEMSNVVSGDLDGSGDLDENDRFGYLYFSDSCATMYNALGNFFGTKNANGDPEITFYTDHAAQCWEKLTAFLQTDATLSMSTELSVYKGKGDYDVIVAMVEGKNTLFTWCHMRNISMLRSVETSFGVIPNPKWDEMQSEYYTQNDPYGAGFVSVPITCPDIERTGLLLEAFSAKSMEVVTPAYYTINLEGKYMRDEESLEMLDIIFSTMTYDIGDIYNWGNMMEQLTVLWNKESPDLASLWAKLEKKTVKDLEKTVERFNEIIN